MKAHPHIFSFDGWDFSMWFAILSPLIGIVVGLLGLFVFAQ
jgi:hypothetical protein